MRDGRGEDVRQDEFSEIEVERGPAVGHDHADELRLLPASGAPEQTACRVHVRARRSWDPTSSTVGPGRCIAWEATRSGHCAWPRRCEQKGLRGVTGRMPS